MRQDSVPRRCRYPVRAQCLRLIPISSSSARWDVAAHFLGCGTGRGILRRCGQQKAALPRRRKRVVGGRPADVGWWPWLASLQVKLPGERDFRHACGASVIHPMYVMTAAHCVNVIYSLIEGAHTTDYSLWNSPRLRDVLRIQVGDNGGSVLHATRVFADVSAVRAHPYYDASEYQFDAAILELVRPLRLTDHVNTVCLRDEEATDPPGEEAPDPPGEEAPDPPGKEAPDPPGEEQEPCVVVGWGAVGHHDTGEIRPHHAQVRATAGRNCPGEGLGSGEGLGPRKGLGRWGRGYPQYGQVAHRGRARPVGEELDVSGQIRPLGQHDSNPNDS